MAPSIAQREQGRASETSPLLPKPEDNNPHPIDPSNGISPEGADPYIDNEDDGGDIERQTSNGDSSKHQGLPEVQKRMKYIFPAIAIGVHQAPYLVHNRSTSH
tara:strand:- start:16854 stop:17162 length:309 start_codon:yes stop_codon:yes gene_type:complete